MERPAARYAAAPQTASPSALFAVHAVPDEFSRAAAPVPVRVVHDLERCRHQSGAGLRRSLWHNGQIGLAEPKLAERRLVGGDGFEPPTLSV
jgi:hypothetical protein